MSNRLTDSIFMRVDEFKMCTNNNNLVSIQDLALQLGIKQEVTYHLINIGLIASIKKGRAGRFVTRESIDGFLNEYTFLNDIAKSLGTSSKFLIEKVIKNRFALVSGPTIDLGRKYLISKSDENTVCDLFRRMRK